MKTFFNLLIISILVLTQNAFGQRKRTPSQSNDKGDIKVVWNKVSNKEYAEFQEDLKKEHFMEDMAEYLNETFSMPEDLFITCDECGEENAFYDPESKKIIICYEMIDYLYEILEKKYKGDKLDEVVWNATTFILFHELGHALIDIYDLPMVGKEEDTVDNFSAYFLTTTGEDADTQAVLDGAWAFRTMSEESEKDQEVKDLPLWGVHSLDSQRFYNIACMVYGSAGDSKKYRYLVKKGYLPADRADGCIDEYEKVARSWDKLLEPWLKPQN